jgi:hypothetical protein
MARDFATEVMCKQDDGVRQVEACKAWDFREERPQDSLLRWGWWAVKNEFKDIAGCC